MAARFLDPKPIWYDDEGLPCAGGRLDFYEDDTTTPKDVFAEKAMSTNLGPSVDLDASGRAESDIWFEGSCYVRLFNVANEQIWARANVEDGAFAGNAPLAPEDGEDGQVYSTDGTPGGAYWRDVEEVPDPAGHSGKYLGNDGELVQWTAFPTAVTYDYTTLPGGIESSTTTIRIGNQVLVKGTATAPTSATTASTVPVSFGYTFASAPEVWVTPKVGAVTSESARCSAQALSASTTGFTASVFAGAEDGGGDLSISTAVPVSWMAWGTAP